ncbi:hypothetical protein ACONUD_06995 [Microbulbifer harenosus]|uniref:hypothetical protein n=1 Tax=Microbulbifer TaxID=48073 RepID=UPI001409098B|nr:MULTISPECIES: hypothetical protein [Microbulbifer]
MRKPPLKQKDKAQAKTACSVQSYLPPVINHSINMPKSVFQIARSVTINQRYHRARLTKIRAGTENRMRPPARDNQLVEKFAEKFSQSSVKQC